MKATIEQGQKTAIDETGKRYQIEGLKLIRTPSKQEVFYDTEEHFYKLACAENTVHFCELLPTGKIMIL